MPNIIIHGNPVDGLQFIGPFPDGEEINEFHTEPLDEWWIASLEMPLSGPLGSERQPDNTPMSNDQWLVTLNSIEADLNAMSEYDRNDAIEALRSRFDDIYTRDSGED